jgi:hypothetical protein
LVTALSAGRLAAGLPGAYWDHHQVDRHMLAADQLLRALDPAEVARPLATEWLRARVRETSPQVLAAG